MGKSLHYSIRPFIERVLMNHMAVKEIEKIELNDFYAYRIKRNFNLSDLIVVLSDDYYFGSSSLQNKPEILKNGGFFLIARPEANGIEESDIGQKLGIGKIGKLLGALNKEEYWEYEPPTKEDE
jgi:hypothetical protein